MATTTIAQGFWHMASGENLGLAGLSPELVSSDFKEEIPQLNGNRKMTHSGTNILCVILCFLFLIGYRQDIRQFSYIQRCSDIFQTSWM